jgi:hypothetical protein
LLQGWVVYLPYAHVGWFLIRHQQVSLEGEGYQLSTQAWNTKGGSITLLLTFCLTGLDWSVLQIKTKIASCHTDDSKPVKQEVNGTVILPPLVFLTQGIVY